MVKVELADEGSQLRGKRQMSSAREKILGIDLGTTNSAAAVIEGGRPVVIPSAEGATPSGKMFPSVVAFTQDGQLLVGEPCEAPGRHQPRRHDLRDQAEDGNGLQGQRLRETVLARTDQLVHPSEDKTRRRGLPRVSGEEGRSSPSPRTSTTTSASRPRTPERSPGWRSSGSSTNRRPRPWPTDWTSRRRR